MFEETISSVGIVEHSSAALMIAVCKTNFIKELTRGQEYLIVDAYGSFFVVVNNANQRRAYHSSYFI